MSQRFKALAELAAATATGAEYRLREAADRCTDNGLASAAGEVLRLAHLFYGFPRVIRALGILEGRLPLAAEAPVAASAETGTAVFRRLYGDDAENVQARLQHLDPVLAGWVVDHAYGRVLGRDGLDDPLTERLAVLMLADTACWKQWHSHVRNAIRHGVSAEQLRADLRCVDWLSEASIDAAESGLARL